MRVPDRSRVVICRRVVEVTMHGAGATLIQPVTHAIATVSRVIELFVNRLALVEEETKATTRPNRMPALKLTRLIRNKQIYKRAASSTTNRALNNLPEAVWVTLLMHSIHAQG